MLPCVVCSNMHCEVKEMRFVPRAAAAACRCTVTRPAVFCVCVCAQGTCIAKCMCGRSLCQKHVTRPTARRHEQPQPQRSNYISACTVVGVQSFYLGIPAWHIHGWPCFRLKVDKFLLHPFLLPHSYFLPLLWPRCRVLIPPHLPHDPLPHLHIAPPFFRKRLCCVLPTLFSRCRSLPACAAAAAAAPFPLCPPSHCLWLAAVCSPLPTHPGKAWATTPASPLPSMVSTRTTLHVHLYLLVPPSVSTHTRWGGRKTCLLPSSPDTTPGLQSYPPHPPSHGK